MQRGEAQAAIHRGVRRLLERSPGYGRLSQEQQAQLARDLVTVTEGIVAAEDPQATAAAVARHLAREDVPRAALDLRPARRRVGALASVDFPSFVADLVQGTFQAIVDASVQQMKAYAELVAGVAKSLDDFADPQREDDD